MKKEITLLFCLLSISMSSFAKCKTSGLNFWPINNYISDNSIIIIEGFYQSQELLNNLGKSNKVYLKSSQNSINLVVQEVLEGQFNLTQAVLRPEKKLTAGLVYELVIENLKNEDELLTRYNPKTGLNEKVSWKVMSKKDKKSPKWISKPTFANSNYMPTACGPSLHSIFNFKISEKSEYLLLTTLKDLKNGVTTHYYLQPENSTVSVGQGMCSGAFDLNNGDFFEAEFTLIDSYGNTTKWKDESIKFEKPK